MSKMGRYVFQLTGDCRMQIGHSDRQAHPRSEADEDTRSTAGDDGDGRFFCGTDRRDRSKRKSRALTSTYFPLATWDDIPMKFSRS